MDTFLSFQYQLLVYRQMCHYIFENIGGCLKIYKLICITTYNIYIPEVKKQYSPEKKDKFIYFAYLARNIILK